MRIGRGVFVVLVGALVGCAEPATVADDPAALGELGARIYLEPERADELLDDSRITREEFEVRVREVAADPETARVYTEAFDRVLTDGEGVAPEA